MDGMTRLALHDLHLAAGARFETRCGLEVPASYGDPAGEYHAVRSAVGVIDPGPRGVVEVTGRDRATFLHALLSNDVKSLGAGQGCAATLLDVHGKVQVTLLVWMLEERIVLVTPPGKAEATVEALDRYLFAEKAALRDATGEVALLMVAGPGAAELTERLAGARPDDRPWSSVTAKLAGTSVRLVRGGGETGEPEVWIVGEANDAPPVWRALVEGGARPVGAVAFESLRVEAGTAVWGHDVDETVLLPEIPFAHLVSYTKGCYVGQEVVVRIRDRGHVNRMLEGLVLEGDTVPAHGAGVEVQGREVGRVTSATRSIGLGRPIALAFVRREYAEPGTRVTVRDGATAIEATVSGLPFTRR